MTPRAEQSGLVRLVLRLAARRLPPEDRDQIVGDLLEQQADEGRSQWWLFKEAAALAWGMRTAHRQLDDAPRPLGHRFDTAIQDLRYAVRSLWRARGFTAVAVLTLMLGIGLTTAVHSLVEGILLRPLPYGASDRIVRVVEIKDPAQALRTPSGAGPAASSGVSDVLTGQLFARSTTLAAISAVSTAGARIFLPDGAAYGQVANVSGAFFEIFPAVPVHGRLLNGSDARKDAAPVVVASYAFWRSALHADPAAVGKQLVVADAPHLVVGVLPSSFAFPDSEVQLWRIGDWIWPEPGGRRMFSTSTDVVARLAPGVSPSQAQAEADRIAGDVAAADPRFWEGAVPPSTTRVEPLRDSMVREIRPALLMLMAGVGCVLLIACGNLANLLLARGASRQRELAVRAALGGSRLRVIRPALVEHVLLAAVGGMLGVGFAWLLLRLAPGVIPENVPRLAELGLHASTLAAAAGLSALVALVFGLLPALQVPRGRLRDALGAGRASLLSRSVTSADRLRSLLVIAQIAGAVVLLIGAGLLARSFEKLMSVDTGYRADETLTFQIKTDDGLYRDADRQSRHYQELIDRIAAHPRVDVAGYSSQLPLLGGLNSSTVTIEGQPRSPDPSERPRTHNEFVTPGYFRAVGLPILKGRGFTPADNETATKVAIVNDEFVRRYLGDRNPIGVSIQSLRDWHTVVGVVSNKRNAGPAADVRPEMFVPFAQAMPIFRDTRVAGGFAVRASVDPLSLVPFIREQARAVDPRSPVHNIMTLEDRVWRATGQPRFHAAAVGAFSAFALITAMLGIYGVLAYAVERRRVEFGVRRALGADASQIVQLVLRRGLGLAAIGLPIGLVAAALSVKLLRSLLFGVEPGDPATFAAVAASVLLVAVLASIVPARRALRVQPTEALRAD